MGRVETALRDVASGEVLIHRLGRVATAKAATPDRVGRGVEER